MEKNNDVGSLNAKRTYQDSLFRFMFSNKESVIELYNAIEGTNYGLDTEVEFTTLTDVLYTTSKNDMGFKIGGKYVVLTEHQSTINYNMPLRHLEYITQTIKNELANRDLYKCKMIEIPTPEFYVIYTGEKDWNTEELRLSNSYKGEKCKNSLELVVKVIDVRYNKEKVNEVLSKSDKLKGYSLLIAYTREFIKQGADLNTAVDLAVRRCIEEDILKDFFTAHGMEVKGMIFEDISIEEFVTIRGEEQFEEGIKVGEERLSKLIQKLMQDERMEDLKRASEDKVFREELIKQYGL